MGGGRQRRRGHGGSVHVHSLVYVLAEVSSEAGWMHVYVCVLVCGGGGGWVSRQEGQTVQPQDKLPPKSRSLHSTRTLVLCDGKARRGGVGGERLCHRE